jgi:hypothetical protein
VYGSHIAVWRKGWRDEDGLFSVAAMDVVAASEHVVYGGLVAVAWCFGLAVAGRVAVVGAKAVAPAVVESVERALRRCRSARLVGLCGWIGGSASVASVSGCEVTASLLVGSVEVGFELGDCVLFFRELTPVFDDIGKHACFLEVLSGCSDCGGCGDWIDVAGEGEAGAELLPEIFNGLFGGPWAMEVGEILSRPSAEMVP